MEQIEKIQSDLKQILSEKRYLHSIGVMEMARKLAKHHNVDVNIAALTGLVHDIGKEISDEEKLNYVNKYNIEADEIELHNVGLLHAKIGADIAKRKYNFDEDMQNAIKYHTTAHPNMNLLAKIVFIADKTEENRIYEGVEELRNLALKDIDECMLLILEYEIKAQISKGKLIHPNSVSTRNKLLLEKR